MSSLSSVQKRKGIVIGILKRNEGEDVELITAVLLKELVHIARFHSCIRIDAIP